MRDGHGGIAMVKMTVPQDCGTVRLLKNLCTTIDF
jgi:hypothetical protein